MYIQWRFDQGRGTYHAFENVQRLASGLFNLSGQNPRTDPCVIKATITPAFPHLDFLPNKAGYTAWRNYARTFGLLQLAPVGRNVDKIEPTTVCEAIAQSGTINITSFDEYFEHLIGHWRYPHPAFEQYSHLETPVYPILAILKFLINRVKTKVGTRVTLDEILEHLVFNNVTGLEDIADFSKIKPNRSISPKADEKRQLRELVKFISQSSILLFDGDAVELAIGCQAAEQALTKIDIYTSAPLSDRRQEALATSSLSGSTASLATISKTADDETARSDDDQFTEGSSIRKVHLRVERNPALRKAFLASLQDPVRCDVCSIAMSERYPWAKDFIEVHHLLPLANAVRIGKTSTSFSDLVPVCPNCHRAIHYGYGSYLKTAGKSDFDDETEARSCYGNLKSQYI